MQSSFVRLEIENAVGTITFFTPDHNALPSVILNELEEKITDAKNNDQVKVLILRSGGDRTFCAGASFKELIAITTKEEGKSFFMGFARVILAMRACLKPIIVRVQGKAVGGGVGIAAAADYCIATKFAAIKLSELSIGIGPFVIEPAVTRKLGVSASSEMTWNATKFYDPQWAKEKGLYSEVYDSLEETDLAIDSLAQNLASYNPIALKEAKHVFWRDTDNWPALLPERAEISGGLVLSEFTKEKLKAYA